MKFRAQDGLIWRRWGDEYVVYNPVSGESHLLDLISAQGLMVLESHAASAEQLAHDLGVALELPADDELDRYVQQMINELSELGLTRSVRS